MSTEQINASEIARDVGLSSVTVKEYFQILEDTLIGNFLYPFSYLERKSLKTSPKFYLFDVGVVRALQGKLSISPESTPFEYGKYFENWFVNEVKILSKYLNKDWKLSFLRTKSNVELDLIIETPRGKTIALEIKSKKWPDKSDYNSGFEAIKRFKKDAQLICVCNGDRARIEEGVEILPVKDALRFLEEE